MFWDVALIVAVVYLAIGLIYAAYIVACATIKLAEDNDVNYGMCVSEVYCVFVLIAFLWLPLTLSPDR